MSNPFKFEQAPNLAVFVCTHVIDEGLPILFVAHDVEGDWQMHCGSEHPGVASIQLVCLADMLFSDTSLNELADLGCSHFAQRSAPGEDWSITDQTETLIRENISQYGWHIVIVGEEGDEPGFAYSIGMQETLGHPELFVTGLPGDLMSSIINELGTRIHREKTLALGTRMKGLLEGADCILQRVHKDHFREFFGYARWYYSGDRFEVLQCFWPGKIDGLFPWEPGCDALVQSQQPDLQGVR